MTGKVMTKHTSAQVSIQTIETMFEFSSEQHWINKAKSWYGSIPKYRREDFLAVDAAGRVCTCGGHFMRATRENSYPVTVYRVNEL